MTSGAIIGGARAATNTRVLRVLQWRELRRGELPYPGQRRHLVVTEIRDGLGDEEIAVETAVLPGRRPVSRELHLFSAAFRARKRADVLIVGQGTGLRLAALRALGVPIPRLVVISYDPFPAERPDVAPGFRKRLESRVRSFLYSKCAALAVHSTTQRDELRARLKTVRVGYVPMSIDQSSFQPGGQPREDFLLVTDGGLRDYETLASAIEIVERKPAALVVVSSATARRDGAGLASTSGISGDARHC